MNPMKALYSDGSVKETEDVLPIIRHTASHVLAQAVKRLYPNTKLSIGPAIDDGFYYDFDKDGGFTPEDLEKLEAEMKKIVKENLKIETYTLPRQEAIDYLKSKGEDYKVQLVEDLPDPARLGRDLVEADRRGVLVGVVDVDADAGVLGGAHDLDGDDVDAVVCGLRLERLEDLLVGAGLCHVTSFWLTYRKEAGRNVPPLFLRLKHHLRS